MFKVAFALISLMSEILLAAAACGDEKAVAEVLTQNPSLLDETGLNIFGYALDLAVSNDHATVVTLLISHSPREGCEPARSVLGSKQRSRRSCGSNPRQVA